MFFRVLSLDLSEKKVDNASSQLACDKTIKRVLSFLKLNLKNVNGKTEKSSL